MNLPKSLPLKYVPRVAHWDDERAIGNSIIISLNDGWEFAIDPFEARHVEGFDNVKDAVQAVRDAEPCNCEQCLLNK